MNILSQLFSSSTKEKLSNQENWIHKLEGYQEMLVRMKALISHLSDPIFGIEPDGTIFFVSQGAGFALHRQPAELEGRKFYLILPFEPKASMQEGLIQLVETRETVRLEVTDNDRPMMMIINPMLNPTTGKLIGGLVEVRDLTEKKRLQQMQLDFAAIISHELRTPISSIKGYLDIVIKEDSNLSPEHRQFLERAYLSNERQAKTVEKLLALSNLERGNVEVNMSSVDIGSVIGQVVAELKPEAQDKELDLKFQFAKFAVPPVRADEQLLYSVVMNLIDNAIKYTAEGSITVMLNLRSDQVVVDVVDTGPGIATEMQERLFDKFVRGEHSLTESTQGSGLGLYLARRFVELMGGKMWVKSAEGQGSTFSFSLSV